MAVSLSLAPKASALDLLFDTSSLTGEYASGSNVWITLQPQRSETLNIAYVDSPATQVFSFQTGTSIMSNSVQLSDILSNGGLSISNVTSGAFFVSYGTSLSSVNSSPAFVGAGTDYTTKFQPFEVTYNGGSGDQGNLTNINYFTAPLSITSYHGGVSGSVVQSTGFTVPTSTIQTQLGALTPGNGNAVFNGSGDVVRYIGPSSYGASPNPYVANPNMDNYLTHIATLSGTAGAPPIVMQNHNAFVVSGTTLNYNFTVNFDTVITGSGSNHTITLTGSVTTQETTTVTTGSTISGLTLTLTESGNQQQFMQAIYGQNALATPDAATYGGNWSQLETYMQSIFGASAGSANFLTTQNLLAGEITTALNGGWILNTGGVNPNGPSDTWWTQDPMVAYAQNQPGNPYYNGYADVIYEDSNNGSYGIPYSDRLGNGPLVNTTQFSGTTVDTWVVGLGDPVTNAVPEPGTTCLATLGGLAALIYAVRRRRTAA